MYIIEHYNTAVLCCVITMLCWGSWGNTQKLASKSWRFELFYWDYVIGILLFSIISAFTLGSTGDQGRSFLEDLAQASATNISLALLGGIIFNAANILLSSAISIAGMAVAFPIGIGLALVLGVVINFTGTAKGDPLFLFTGVALITLAVLVNALAYHKSSKDKSRVSSKGIMLSIAAGILMSFFYRFIAASMDMDNFIEPAIGKMTPYTAVFVFSSGIFLSNFLFNTILMKKPFEGAPLDYSTYFKGKLSTHMVGVFGGMIWGIGNSFNLIAAGKAGPAISYGLGQGATLIAALWGVYIWKEFKDSPPVVNQLIKVMFILFFIGLGLVIYAGAN